MKRVRKEILRLGRRGRLVRVVEDTNHGDPVYVVLYRKVDGRPGEKLYPRSKTGKMDAIAFAQGAADELRAQLHPAAPEQLTVSQLFRRFLDTQTAHLRPNSIRLYRERWGHWEAFVGPHAIAEELGWESMGLLRTYLERDRPRPLAVSNIAAVFTTVRYVYRWARGAKLIRENQVDGFRYRIAKEQRVESPDEYRMDEFRAILAQLPVTSARHWRAHVALTICGYQGARQNAVLHLRWADVDFEGGTIRWRPEFDKLGNDWSQPLRVASRRALIEAQKWSGDEEWVFPASRVDSVEPCYTIQSLWLSLVKAEARAGVESKARRAGHGLRRLLAGEVADLTGNADLAMKSIGDRDPKMALRYIKRRDDVMKDVFDQLDERTEVHP